MLAGEFLLRINDSDSYTIEETGKEIDDLGGLGNCFPLASCCSHDSILRLIQTAYRLRLMRTKRLIHFINCPVLFACLALGTFSAVQAKEPANELKWNATIQSARKAMSEGDTNRAEKLFKQSVEQAAAFGNTDQRLIASMMELAALYKKQRKLIAARDVLVRVLPLKESLYGKESPELIPTLNAIIAAGCAADRCYDGIPYLKRLLAIRQKAYGKDSKDIPVTLLLIGEAYEKQNKFDLAISYFKQASDCAKRRSDERFSRILASNVDRVSKKKARSH